MDKSEFFRDLGFGEYESKLLSSFVKLKTAEVKELSLDSGVPRNKLYSIVKKLEDDGVIGLVSVEPKKYKLINLDGFVEEKIREKEEKLKKLKKRFENIDKIEVDEKFVFSLIKGQKTIMNKIVEINKVATKEIFGVQRNWKYWGEGIRMMEKVVKRGVDVRLIGLVNEETIERVNEWKKTGAKIRVFDKKFGEYPLRFSVFDSKYARITIGKPEIKDSKDYITIWSDSKPLVRMLRNQFLEMWKQSEIF
jgi:sugar-specific transcriptional regulator TrmB